MEKLAQHNQSVEVTTNASVRQEGGNFFLRDCDLSYRNQDDSRGNPFKLQ
jgi:hypothetical protein